jgi:hypothetical protein
LIEQRNRFSVSPKNAFAGDHFRYYQPRAPLQTNLPECTVGKAGHRCKKKIAWRLNSIYRDGVVEM